MRTKYYSEGPDAFCTGLLLFAGVALRSEDPETKKETR